MGWLFGETVKKDANYHGCRYVWAKLHQKESDLVKLKKVFDAADRSGDGEVDIHEFLMYGRGVPSRHRRDSCPSDEHDAGTSTSSARS